MIKLIKAVIVGIYSQLRSMWMVFSHAFRKRDTIDVSGAEGAYLPPRYRGRIVLTRDPDGEERCVACNLCAVACPVGCISLQKAET
jgi:NADH-quinone oxidoreductase subunit I